MLTSTLLSQHPLREWLLTISSPSHARGLRDDSSIGYVLRPDVQRSGFVRVESSKAAHTAQKLSAGVVLAYITAGAVA